MVELEWRFEDIKRKLQGEKSVENKKVNLIMWKCIRKYEILNKL